MFFVENKIVKNIFLWVYKNLKLRILELEFWVVNIK